MILGPSASSSSEVVSVSVIIDTVTEQLLAGVEDGLGGCRLLTEAVKGGEWNNLFVGDCKLGEDDLLNNLQLSDESIEEGDDLETGVEVKGTAGGRGC